MEGTRIKYKRKKRILDNSKERRKKGKKERGRRERKVSRGRYKK